MNASQLRVSIWIGSTHSDSDRARRRAREREGREAREGREGREKERDFWRQICWEAR